MDMVEKQCIAERFWRKVRKGDQCWEWTGTRNAQGYGTFNVGGSMKRATHVAIFLADGIWPAKGLLVCHKCDNPSCVRRDHLFLGSSRDNRRDCVRKGRAVFNPIRPEQKPRGEAHGLRKLTEAAVRDIRSSSLSSYRLGKVYGVTTKCVINARKGITWAHL